MLERQTPSFRGVILDNYDLVRNYLSCLDLKICQDKPIQYIDSLENQQIDTATNLIIVRVNSTDICDKFSQLKIANPYFEICNKPKFVFNQSNIFCISLDTKLDRWERVKSRLEQLG